jgi:hypothetical protein
MNYLPGSGELYLLSTLLMCVFSRLFASSVAPRSGFVPIVLYLVLMLFFAVAEFISDRQARPFLVQCAFAIVPAAVTVCWMAFG